MEMLFCISCGPAEQKQLVTRDSFADMTLDGFHISEKRIRTYIADLMYEDHDRQAADLKVKDYYKNAGPFLWIGRDGVMHSADSVLKYVALVKEMGFSQQRFRLETIQRDKQTIDSLNLGDENINRVLARLEYNLTKAYLSYCIGQRFGYTSPKKIFNRLDVRDSDSVHKTYNVLFDVPVKTPSHDFVLQAFNKVRHDSVGWFLRQSVPHDPLYARLQTMLARPTSAADRKRILCNMERCRWNVADSRYNHKKYVLLNIPSQELDAIDGDNKLSMRVVCGSQKTKTPLLQSYISRIELNPQWIIPKSIVKKSVAPHAGDVGYFERHRYFIQERKTGKQLNPALATPAMLVGNDFHVIQRGGKGNALGRMIFRFKNNFSVYLHDTSNPALFSANDRLASHGCVRVQRPYDLAVFLLEDKDEVLLDKIKYSFTFDWPVPVKNNNNDEGENETVPAVKVDKTRLLRTVTIKPQVPLYIIYYTLFNTADGQLQSYPDIYGYDNALYEVLKLYL